MRKTDAFDDILSALFFVLASNLLFYSAASFATDSVVGSVRNSRSETDTLPPFFFMADGDNFRRILEEGYSFDPANRSLVAFFPLYPLTARAMISCGLSREWSLIAAAQLAQVLSLFAFRRYVRRCVTEDDSRLDLSSFLVVAFPMHLFWCAAYSEPLFFLLACLVFLGIRGGWSPWSIAAIAGIATGCRSVGVAFASAVLWYAWKYKPEVQTVGTKWRIVSLGGIAFLSLSGLLAYMVYQAIAFGEPLAFAQTQKHWRMVPKEPMNDKILSLVTLEPVWRAFDTSSLRSILRSDRSENPFSNALLWHILLWLLSGALLIIGIRKREISIPEAIAWLGLWLIPYITRGEEMAMHSQGRFVSVIAPMYIVLANRLAKFPEVGRWGIGILFILVQILLTMQFALGRTVI